MAESTFYINESGFPDDAGFRDPQFDVELARARATAAKPVTASLPPLADAPQNIPVHSGDEVSEPEGQLTIDVYQTPTDIVIESPIAGVDVDSLDVQVSQDAVAIRGERRSTHEAQGRDYLYQECYWGKFSRSVILPQEVDADAAVATYAGGVLHIRLPKLVRRNTRKLKVRFN